jgi:hypothetical protein
MTNDEGRRVGAQLENGGYRFVDAVAGTFDWKPSYGLAGSCRKPVNA